jgi:O-antigen ligase
VAQVVVIVAIAVASALAAAALFAFAFLLLRRVEIGLVALVVLFTASAWFGPVGVLLGSLLVMPVDLLCVLFIMAAAVRWSGQRLSPAQLAWVALGGLIFLSLLLGIQGYGLGPAGNQARASGVLFFWSCAAYFSSFQDFPKAERALMRVLTWGGAAIVPLVFVRWGLELAGIEVTARAREVGAQPFRVIPSEEAMFLASLMIVLFRKALDLPAEASKWLWAAVVLLTALVLLLQHRSVWLAAVSGMLVLAMLDWQKVRKLTPYFAAAAVPAGLAVGAMLVKGSLDDTVAALSYSVQNEGTLSWRVEGWLDLLAQWRNSGGVGKLLGEPFGVGFSRYLSSLGVIVERSPHNSYLTLLLKVGILGLALFVLTYALCLKRLLALRRNVGNGRADYLLAVLAAQSVYFMFYGPHIMQAVFFGAALSLCAVSSAGEAAAEAAIGNTTGGAVGRC